MKTCQKNFFRVRRKRLTLFVLWVSIKSVSARKNSRVSQPVAISKVLPGKERTSADYNVAEN